MPDASRIVTAVSVAIIALAAILAMLIINDQVGLWEWGSRLDTSRFVPGTGPAPMVGEVGSGLHLPLDGGR